MKMLILNMITRIKSAIVKRIWKYKKNKILFIHTPKCGGTFIQKNYNLEGNTYSIGHGSLSTMFDQIGSNTKIVGLLREPCSWYQSYISFCQLSLEKQPRSNSNFPLSHPIPFFLKNASIDQFSSKMLSFLNNSDEAPGISTIYGIELNGVFDFMRNTQSGFYTFTIIYHFSRINYQKIDSEESLLDELLWIKDNVHFIRQEHITIDASKYFTRIGFDNSRINSSFSQDSSSYFTSNIRATENLIYKVFNDFFD